MLRHKGDCGFYLSRLSSDSVRFWGCLETQWACYGRSRALLQMCLKISCQVSKLIGGGDQDSEQCSKQKLRWRSECHTYLQALIKQNKQTGNSLKTFRHRSRRASNKSVDKWLLSRYKTTPHPSLLSLWRSWSTQPDLHTPRNHVWKESSCFSSTFLPKR